MADESKGFILVTDLADNRDYDNAKAYCEGQTGNLATFKTTEEYDLVFAKAMLLGRVISKSIIFIYSQLTMCRNSQAMHFTTNTVLHE